MQERLWAGLKENKYWVIGTMALCCLVFGAAFSYANARRPSVQEEPNISTIVSSEEQEPIKEDEPETKEKETNSPIYVDIKGAVLHPGVYLAKEGERVQSIVKKAGGLTEKADSKKINLASIVEDQQLIYVAEVGEAVAAESDLAQVARSGSGNKGRTDQSSAEKTIDLNTASESELQELSGIGQKKAQDIIAYREEKGGFKSIDDLLEISGFGEKTVEKLRDSVRIE